MNLEGILGPVQKQPLTQRVADTIKRYILGEGLQSGDPLPAERQLAETLAVSRTVLREALGILVGEGLITKEAGRGIFVLPFDRDTVSASFSFVVDNQAKYQEELTELRIAIEVGTLRSAMQRIQPEQVDRLKSLVKVMEEKFTRSENIVHEDLEFHCILLGATDNRMIAQFCLLIEEQMRLSVERNPHALKEERDEWAVHTLRELLQAIIEGDVWQARRAMERHFHIPSDAQITA